jgi:hypothetical protein
MAEEQKEYDLPDDQIRWVAPKAYRARPLAGVWATAPYLHNGSVPTLDDLLRPEEERPVVFPVGPPEYDPVKVGVVSSFSDVPREQRGRMGIYDTRVRGNSNRGHSGKEFGTDLSPKQRAELLEYLKSLGGVSRARLSGRVTGKARGRRGRRPLLEAPDQGIAGGSKGTRRRTRPRRAEIAVGPEGQRRAVGVVAVGDVADRVAENLDQPSDNSRATLRASV